MLSNEGYSITQKFENIEIFGEIVDVYISKFSNGLILNGKNKKMYD